VKAEAVTEDGFENDDGRTKNYEFGGVVGGGLEYMFGSFSVTADVRYSLGATSFATDVAGQSVDLKNRGVAVMGGIGIPLGKQQ
jgi:hypothetical protein